MSKFDVRVGVTSQVAGWLAATASASPSQPVPASFTAQAPGPEVLAQEAAVTEAVGSVTAAVKAQTVASADTTAAVTAQVPGPEVTAQEAAVAVAASAAVKAQLVNSDAVKFIVGNCGAHGGAHLAVPG